MACMHKKTFDIYHNDQCIIPDGYIEIDELIAPSIQVLNRKGYITRWCCSGHPLKNYLLRNGSEAGYEVIIHGRQPDGTYLTGGQYESYISFKESISLPTLPPGFGIDPSDDSSRLIIRSDCCHSFEDILIRRKKYATIEVFELSREILERMERG